MTPATPASEAGEKSPERGSNLAWRKYLISFLQREISTVSGRRTPGVLPGKRHRRKKRNREAV